MFAFSKKICGKISRIVCSAILFAPCLLPSTARSQTVPGNAISVTDALLKDAQMARQGNNLYLSPNSLSGKDSQADVGEQQGAVTIPRIAASLVGVQWLGQKPSESFSLKVEQDHWIVNWKDRPKAAQVIELTFDSQPKLLSEVRATVAAGDGSIYLPACLATTVGEKIRYEPQTFKNTVGYWVGKQDFARWEFSVDEPGSYNVCILQGCGTGQGGSTATLTVGEGNDIQSVAFEVLETGHFQNFQWRTIGQVDLTRSGVFPLKIAPTEIKKNALMDVRAVHLVRLPK